MTETNVAAAKARLRSRKAATAARKVAAVARYRARNRRFDYVPSPAALKAIERHRGLDLALVGVIDKLILAGDPILSGNESGPGESKGP